MQQIVPKRLVPKNTKPTVLTAEVDEKKERWRYPTPPDKLSEDQKQAVMGSIIGKMVEVVFKTHYYEWNGKIYVQVGGCPQGLRPSGPISRCFMGDWREEMIKLTDAMNILAKLKPILFSTLEFHLLDKYVDDCISASTSIRKGCKWDSSSKAMIWDSELAKTDARSNEERTMEEIGRMASSIYGCLNFTWDSPSRNSNSKMPVLDTQLWLQQEEREAKVHPQMSKETITRVGKLKQVIMYEFFKRPMASRLNNR